MKFLLITEKFSLNPTEQDGGARLVASLQHALGDSLDIMQFGPQPNPSATWHFDYPTHIADRFARRMAYAGFIAEQIRAVQERFTHILFVHICMQLGIFHCPLREDLVIWTFPMFLTPSYRASGECVPDAYYEMEKLAFSRSTHIITPSYFEKGQLVSDYHVAAERIHVIPRGIHTQGLQAKTRTLSGPLEVCSVGSIKPQKNTLGLIHLFSQIRVMYPHATLRLIGPIQNIPYYQAVQKTIDRLKLGNCVTFMGFVPPESLASALLPCHLHISTSACETFGRSIFETLACGLPNIVRNHRNAASAFLKGLPYIHFVDHDAEALQALSSLLAHLPQLSSLAAEIGELYDDVFLANLLKAKICNKSPIGISDYDGTLFHKNDPIKTQRSMEAFRRFSPRIICSARPLEDILSQLHQHQLSVDWIISHSGACVSNGLGENLWMLPLDSARVTALEGQYPTIHRVEQSGHVLQLCLERASLEETQGVRVEIYQDKAYISHWKASKFRAIRRLLRTIGWTGQVRAFGDGRYDAEFLTFFDGQWEKTEERS